MYLAAVLAAAHYLALAIGFGALLMRGVYFKAFNKAPSDNKNLSSLFFADNLWGVAALLWIVTGLLRAFASIEKSPDFYLYNGFFWVKMALFGAIFLLELKPMVTLIRWRIARKKAEELVGIASVPHFVLVNKAELFLLILIPFAATLMARGAWLLS